VIQEEREDPTPSESGGPALDAWAWIARARAAAARVRDEAALSEAPAREADPDAAKPPSSD
jgi:hypothetical protein